MYTLKYDRTCMCFKNVTKLRHQEVDRHKAVVQHGEMIYLAPCQEFISHTVGSPPTHAMSASPSLRSFSEGVLGNPSPGDL